MERCERFEELLSERLDQPLPPQQERELEEHLARCPRCRALAADLEQLCGQFACLEELKAPEGFAQGVMDRIRALEPEPAPAAQPDDSAPEQTEAQRGDKVVPLRPGMPRWARTAAALAACCVLGFGVYQAGLVRSAPPAVQSQDAAAASDSGVTAFMAPGPGETASSGSAATLPAPEAGQEPVYDDWAEQGGEKAEQKQNAAPRTAKSQAQSQTGTQNSTAAEEPAVSAPAPESADGEASASAGSDTLAGVQQLPLQSGELTLSQLPQGAEDILGPDPGWTDREDGSRSCRLSADQARRLSALAREQELTQDPGPDEGDEGSWTLVLSPDKLAFSAK